MSVKVSGESAAMVAPTHKQTLLDGGMFSHVHIPLGVGDLLLVFHNLSLVLPLVDATIKHMPKI